MHTPPPPNLSPPRTTFAAWGHECSWGEPGSREAHIYSVSFHIEHRECVCVCEGEHRRKKKKKSFSRAMPCFICSVMTPELNTHVDAQLDSRSQ